MVFHPGVLALREALFAQNRGPGVVHGFSIVPGVGLRIGKGLWKLPVQEMQRAGWPSRGAVRRKGCATILVDMSTYVAGCLPALPSRAVVHSSLSQTKYYSTAHWQCCGM